MKKKNEGITLVALVITIIILLILAGITINSLMGSGLFEKAKEAKVEYSKAGAKEKVQMEVLASYDTRGNLDLVKLKDNLSNINNIENLPETITAEDFPLKIIVDGYEVEIENDGTVSVEGEQKVPVKPVKKCNLTVNIATEKNIVTDFTGKTITIKSADDMQNYTLEDGENSHQFLNLREGTEYEITVEEDIQNDYYEFRKPVKTMVISEEEDTIDLNYEISKMYLFNRKYRKC